MTHNSELRLRYFKESEYRGWWSYIDTSLLVRTDCFRSILGYAVTPSSAEGAIGRHGTGTSMHNYKTQGGLVRAVDYGCAIYEPRRWVEAARLAGFTGIGFYPLSKHIHLDVRPTDIVAEWASIEEGKPAVSLDAGLRFAEQRK